MFEIREAKERRDTLLNIEEQDKEFNIPEFSLKDKNCNSVNEAVDIINEKLGMSHAKRSIFSLEDWIKKIELLGVLVFQFYDIKPKGLRGYALYHDKLPNRY